MSDRCAPHRPYIGAIADQELELVPPEAREHVQECVICRQEVATHQLLNRRVRSAAQEKDPVAPRAQRRLPILRLPVPPWQVPFASIRLRLAAALALVLIVAAGTLVWHARTSPDLAGTAVSMASGGPQLYSGDYGQIRGWCIRTSGRPLPVTPPSSLHPRGARMDPWSGSEAPTLYFTTQSGESVAITWFDADATTAQRGSIEAQSLQGRTVLVVRGQAGTAVLSGSASSSTLWAVAAKLVTTST